MLDKAITPLVFIMPTVRGFVKIFKVKGYIKIKTIN